MTYLLSVDNLTKHYGAKTLFSKASFTINLGDRLGILGVNGSGKTTLLRMLVDLEKPDKGQITVNPKARIAFLTQNPDMPAEISVLDYIFAGDSPTIGLLLAYEQTVLALSKAPHNTNLQKRLTDLNQRMEIENGWGAEANAKAILTQLGITNFDMPLSQLSGGQRRRVALARVLIDPADLLILDEPTNHIDPDTITWLEAYLRDFKGALLMVTHDRYFLDRIVNYILEIDQTQLHTYPGNYSTYLEQKAEREIQQEKSALDRNNMLRRELAWLHRAPMARGGKQKARTQRAEALLEDNISTQSADLDINVASRRTGKQILSLEHISKSFGDKVLIEDFSYVVNKGDRLGVVGPNGQGKSTLLNLITGRLEPDTGDIKLGATIKLGYYDQEGEALDENQRVLDCVTDVAEVIQTADGNQTSASQMLVRFQFPHKVQQNYISTLSGGERRRLYLLRTLMLAPNLLLLDEPTNDLDVQTLSILEDYLESYDGVLITVSHDRYFLDRTVEHIFAFEGDGQIKQYPGNYTAYQAKKAAKRDVTPPPLDKSTKPPVTPEKKSAAAPRKLSYKEKRELEMLEEKIMTLETEKETLSTAINEAGSDYQKLQTLSNHLIDLEAEIDIALERWAELETYNQ